MLEKLEAFTLIFEKNFLVTLRCRIIAQSGLFILYHRMLIVLDILHYTIITSTRVSSLYNYFSLYCYSIPRSTVFYAFTCRVASVSHSKLNYEYTEGSKFICFCLLLWNKGYQVLGASSINICRLMNKSKKKKKKESKKEKKPSLQSQSKFWKVEKVITICNIISITSSWNNWIFFIFVSCILYFTFLPFTIRKTS